MLAELVSAGLLYSVGFFASGAPPPVKIALLEVVPRGVPPDTAAEAGESIARAITSLGGFEVLSREDVKRVLSQQEAVQQLGADAQEGVLAKLGAALGADWLVAGTVSQIEGERRFSLVLMKVSEGRVANRAGRALDKKEKLLGALEDGAKILLNPLFRDESGHLTALASDDGSEVVLDEAVIGATPLRRAQVPGGFHGLSIRREGFIPYRKTIEVRRAQEVLVDAVLIPSPTFVQQYKRKARLQRIGKWVGLAAFATLGAATTYMFYDANREQGELDREHDRLDGRIRERNLGASSAEGGKLRAEFEELQTKKNRTIGKLQSIGVALGVGAVIAVAGGVYFWLTQVDGSYYDNRLPPPDSMVAEAPGEKSR